ncbi:MAG: pilus assembly protein [Bacilli bacterium]|nr:pilus assembly protein [Bacilli bacterium]
MKNNKGQALVEFVIILPIFLLLVISVIDFGNIISKKYSLENDIDTLSSLYRDEKYKEINSYTNKKNIKVEFTNDGDLTNIVLSKDIRIISPMLNLVFGKSYDISVEKSIYNEQ